MSMSDPIADMIARVNNAQLASLKVVSLPASKIKLEIARVLQQEGYILDYAVEKHENNKSTLHLNLKYYQGKRVIETIKRVSKPSLRIYKGKDDLPKVLGDLGIAIVSTSKGVMTNKEARQSNIGGEILCFVS